MAFARRLHAELVGTASDHTARRWIVAVGGRAAGLLDAVTSHRQAERAAQVAAAVSSFGDVVDWDELGVYRVLAELPADRFGPEVIHPALSLLIDDPRTHSLIHTVERYLDNAGDAQATAAELFVHRTSLYHRLRRFERAAGFDLSSGGDRLIVHLGLKLARLQGRSWATTDSNGNANG
jgi:DNA-binding PucR family transcriptional regulator